MRRVLGLAVLLVLLAAAPATGAPRSYQIDAAHSGRVPAGGPAPPLERIWERRIGGRLSYPLIAGRRVFVASRRTDVAPVHVHALDRATGRTLWRRATGPTTHGELAYEDGRVFVAASNDVRALDARTGELVWLDAFAPSRYGAGPVVRDGRLFLHGGFVGEAVQARRAGDGTLLWRSGVADGEDDMLAVDAGHVYHRDCASITSLAVADGARAWAHFAGADCEAFLGEPVAVLGDRLVLPNVGPEGEGALAYPRSGPTPSGELASGRLAPVEAGGRTVAVEQGALVARDAGGTEAWRVTPPAPIETAPLAGRGRVYAVDRDGRVLVVDAASGRVRTPGRARGGLVARKPAPLALGGGLAADAALLLVPAGRRLTAFGRSRPQGRARAPRRGAALPGRAPREATTLQLDPAHRGWSPRGLRLPLRPGWTQAVQGTPAYALIAGGRVIVAAGPEAHELQSGRRVFARRLIPEGAWVSVGASLSAAGGMLIVPARDRVFAFRGAGGR